MLTVYNNNRRSFNRPPHAALPPSRYGLPTQLLYFSCEYYYLALLLLFSDVGTGELCYFYVVIIIQWRCPENAFHPLLLGSRLGVVIIH